MVGLVNLEDDQAWLLRHDEFVGSAQQRALQLQLYFYVETDYVARPGCHKRDFDKFRLECRIADLFGLPQSSTETLPAIPLP